ncbi:MAG: methyltransferase domain-containing protein [Candidatus Asgardarchaeia archaeon]
MDKKCESERSSYRTFFDKISRIYDVGVRILTLGQEQKIRGRLVDLLISSLEVYEAPPKILDLCTGTGQMAIIAKKKIPYAHIVGIDASPKMLAVARKKIIQERLDIQFKQCDILKLPFKDNTFDGVISFLCMHELSRENRSLVLKEINRVLKKDGILAIADYSFPETPFHAAIFKLVMLVEEESAKEFISKPLIYELEQHDFIVIHFQKAFAGFIAYYISRKGAVI